MAAATNRFDSHSFLCMFLSLMSKFTLFHSRLLPSYSDSEGATY